jgi:hypothetical protein
LTDKLGIPAVPQINSSAIEQIIKDLIQDPIGKAPTVVEDFSNAVQNEIETFSELGAKALCLLADPTQSIFIVSSHAADLSQGIDIKFQVLNSSGQNILAGMPPSVPISAIFTTTLGTLTPTVFDSEEGIFSATLTSDVIGTAEINAYFVTTDVCMTPRVVADSSSAATTLSIQFLDGSLKPRRQDRHYVQSLGGRRR